MHQADSRYTQSLFQGFYFNLMVDKAYRASPECLILIKIVQEQGVSHTNIMQAAFYHNDQILI